MSVVSHSIGGRLHIYSATDCNACVCKITTDGLEIAHTIGNYLREVPHVGTSDDNTRRLLQKSDL